MPSDSKRVFYVDTIRAWAILWVVISHVFAPVVWAMKDYPLGVWWVFNLADSVIRLCVPLFIMISGKLLLNSTRQETYGQFIRRRFGKIVPAYFVWFMIYKFTYVWMTDLPSTPGKWLWEFLTGVTDNHLYFMYIILGLYLIAPFLKKFVQSATMNDLRIVLGLWLGHLTLQFALPTVYMNTGPSATLIGYAGYFLLGYYLDREEKLTGRTLELILLGGGIVLINAFATFRLVALADGKMNERFYGGLTPLVAVYAACTFAVLKNIDQAQMWSHWPRVQKCISYLSLDSYNLYLMHMLPIELFTGGVLGFTLSESTGGSALIGVPLTSLAVFAVCLVFSRLAQKTPILSRLLVIPAA